MADGQHPLEQERDELLQEANESPGVAEALRLQQQVTELAEVQERVALAYEPQAYYGSGFTQPR